MEEKKYLAKGSAALAPMAGVTDMPFRLLCFEQGCDWATTEMVSARGYLCGHKKSRAVRELLRRDPGEGLVALQIFGHEPDALYEAARMLSEEGFCGLDINMGCPAPKIVGNGDGSALLKDLSQARAALAAVRRATSLPVTVKMRLGWDEEHLVAEELAHICQEEGADAITVHGRTRVQFYSGKANWDAIARVKQSVRIPVFGNGDLNTAEEALARMRESGVDGVSIARGATGNPWIFARFAPEGRTPRARTRRPRARRNRHAPCADARRLEGRGRRHPRNAQTCGLVYARHVRRGADASRAIRRRNAGGAARRFRARA